MFQALTIIIFRPTVIATWICIKEYANAYCFPGQQSCRKIPQGLTIFSHIFLKIWVSCSDKSMKEVSSLCLSIFIWLWMFSITWVYCYVPSKTTAVVVLRVVFLFCFDEAGTHLFGKIITIGSLSRQIRNSAMTDLSNPWNDLAFNTKVLRYW